MHARRTGGGRLIGAHGFLLFFTAATLVAAAGGPVAESRADVLAARLQSGELTRAEYALERARALFHQDAVRRRYGFVRAASPQGATSILADLARRWDRLAGRDRRLARALLARPTDNKDDPLGDGYDVRRRRVRTSCRQLRAGGDSRGMCIHWVAKAGDRDAPLPVDRDHDRTPDWVEKTIRVVEEVARQETNDFGYRLPLADRGPGARQGPGRGLDIYLADVGAAGLYGYCTRDVNPATVERNPAGDAPSSADQGVASAVYCVIDDDFAKKQFPAPDVSGIRALKATVAHEFFHAIQFAYSTLGSDWLREGTAVWMEDEVFDRIDANRRYLPSSPLVESEVPLDVSDTPNDGDDSEYGAWIFWRFLSEYFGTRDVIRAVWEEFSLDPSQTVSQSVDSALTGRTPSARCKLFCDQVSFSEAFLEFARWNLEYADAYDEGRDYFARLGCSVFPDAEFSLVIPQQPSTEWRELAVDRLSTGIVSLLANASGPVRITVDSPKGASGAEVAVTRLTPDATAPCGFALTQDRLVPANAEGDRVFEVPGPARLLLTMTNGDVSAAPERELRNRYRADLVP